MIPTTREALKPTAETLQLAGAIALHTTVLGIGGVWTPGWLLVAGYAELRFRSLADQASAAGGVVIEWSDDAGATISGAEPAGTAALGVRYDSGAIPRRSLWVRPTYTNGGAAQLAFRAQLEGYQQAGGSGVGGAPGIDITPNGPALADSTAIGVDVVVNCAATVAGQRYRVSVVGGAGFCIRCDAQNPVVTDEPWYDGQKFTFVATVADAAGVRAIKRTAATADGSVIVTAIV